MLIVVFSTEEEKQNYTEFVDVGLKIDECVVSGIL